MFNICTTNSARDVEILADLAARTFKTAYEGKLRGDALNSFVASAFSREKVREEMNDPACIFLLAEEDGQAIGYAMLREIEPPTSVIGRSPVELARIYLDDKAIGRGCGAALMQACLKSAGKSGNETIWLGVWEENDRAIRFYQQWGFTVVGSQTFDFGGEKQTDQVMMRSV